MNTTRILVDTFWVDKQNGIGVDARNILETFAAQRNVQLINLNSSATKVTILRNFRKFNLTFLGLNTKIDTRDIDVFFQTQVGFGYPSDPNTTWVVRIHDFFPITNPEWFSRTSVKYFSSSLNGALKGGAKLIFNSESTLSEFKRLYKNMTNETMVWYCSEQLFNEEKCGVCLGCRSQSDFAKGEYFLSVGTIEPRKGYLEIVNLWEGNENRQKIKLPLVIIGKYGWKSSKLRFKMKFLKRQGINWISSCCSGSLFLFYRDAAAFISGSLDEGFNISALEARNYAGIPLILRNNPAHYEIHGTSANYFSDSQTLKELVLGVSKLEKTHYLELNRDTQMLVNFLSQ